MGTIAAQNSIEPAEPAPMAACMAAISADAAAAVEEEEEEVDDEALAKSCAVRSAIGATSSERGASAEARDRMPPLPTSSIEYQIIRPTAA